MQLPLRDDDDVGDKIRLVRNVYQFYGRDHKILLLT